MHLAIRTLGLGLGALSLFGCSGPAPNLGTLPRISIPLEESPPPPPAKKAPTPAPTVSLVGNTDPPDPPAQRSYEQVELHLSFEKGALVLLGQKVKVEEQLVLSPRRVGRFAVELFLGAELLERVRFDFPLLGSDADDPAFEKGLTSDTRVHVPLLRRATRARVLDRKTRQQLELPWPPPAEAPSTAAPPTAAPLSAPPASP